MLSTLARASPGLSRSRCGKSGVNARTLRSERAMLESNWESHGCCSSWLQKGQARALLCLGCHKEWDGESEAKYEGKRWSRYPRKPRPNPRGKSKLCPGAQQQDVQRTLGSGPGSAGASEAGASAGAASKNGENRQREIHPNDAMARNGRQSKSSHVTSNQVLVSHSKVDATGVGGVCVGMLRSPSIIGGPDSPSGKHSRK